ncbi:cuticle protein 16.8 [Trichonephila clavata]|uniref:Cuticle protein 16.8 n=1 Tax=Trichonephila clavata TaxID=2740835 RepID=A0A8X6KYD1_TRICU|nr:cuticle protein 16.8 [Trichonephila clavata]
MISQIFVLAALAVAAFANLQEPSDQPTSKSYKFGYSIKDKNGEQYREESGEGGHAVRGSYGFTDAHGIHRKVHYVADQGGFRAVVKTNEPGTANQSPAAVRLISDAPYEQGGYAGNARLGYAGVVAAPVGYVGRIRVGARLRYVGDGLGYAGRYGDLGYGGLGILEGLGYERYGY